MNKLRTTTFKLAGMIVLQTVVWSGPFGVRAAAMQASITIHYVNKMDLYTLRIG